MTRFADPTRCPDCGRAIGYEDLVCPSCRLPLRGDTAARLFQTLTVADQLLDALRARASSLPDDSRSESQRPAGTLDAGRAPGGLSAASVPKILLSLGAACVLIAAFVFLAVTWSRMGVGGRTATLVGLTVAAGGLAAWMARRDLRGAAEALSVVALGLLTLDVYGARDAGWLGEPSTATFLVLLGAVLVAVAAAAGMAAARVPVRQLTGPEVVAGLATGLVAYGIATHEALVQSVANILAVLVALALVAVAYRLRLPYTTGIAGVVAATFWLIQLGAALEAVEGATLRELWVGLAAWRLVVSALLVGAVALVRVLPVWARVAAAATAYAVGSLTVALPALDEGSTAVALTAVAALGVTAVAAWRLPGPWGLTGVITQLAAAVSALAALGAVAVLATTRLVEAGAARWAGTTGGDLVGPVPAEVPEPWLAPLCLLALAGTALALSTVSPTIRGVGASVADRAALTAIGLATGVAALACYDVPVWLVLTVLVLGAAGFVGWWAQRRTLTALAAGAVFLAGAVGLGWYDEWLTVASLTVAVLLAGVVHLRAPQTDVSAVAGAVLAAGLAGSAWTWGALVGGPESWTALAGLGLLAAVVLTLPLYPDAWWSCPAPRAARGGVEVGAAAAGLPLAVAGVLLAAPSTAASWAAVYLTLAGGTVVALSLLRADRNQLAWVGGGLLALASWVRLWDIGVREPEPYTLPTAVVLVALGVWHLRRHPAASTMSALAPGLVLGLVPSLLWLVPEPTGPRPLFLGLGCLILVAAGLRLRWTAPVAVGAVVGALAVLRLAAPYIGDTVPRWVLIGGAGALLIVMGVTWERRLQEARQVMGYVRALR